MSVGRPNVIQQSLKPSDFYPKYGFILGTVLVQSAERSQAATGDHACTTTQRLVIDNRKPQNTVMPLLTATFSPVDQKPTTTS